MRGVLPHLSFGIGSDRYREPNACATGQLSGYFLQHGACADLRKLHKQSYAKAHRHIELVRVVASLLDLGSQARSFDAVLICGPPNIIMAGHGARPGCDVREAACARD